MQFVRESSWDGATLPMQKARTGTRKWQVTKQESHLEFGLHISLTWTGTRMWVPLLEFSDSISANSLVHVWNETNNFPNHIPDSALLKYFLGSRDEERQVMFILSLPTSCNQLWLSLWQVKSTMETTHAHFLVFVPGVISSPEFVSNWHSVQKVMGWPSCG